MMAGQPAIELGLLLPVTVYAESHREIDWDQAIIFTNIPVASNAIDLVPNMGLVIKFDMVRDIEDSNPGYRRLGIIIPPFLHNFRVLGNDIVVTE